MDLFASAQCWPWWRPIRRISPSARTPVIGDVFDLHTARQLQTTGRIYQDPAHTPFVPSAYSPAVYLLMAIPGRFVVSGNPFLLLRVTELTSFLLCVILSGSSVL
jgi:hypothetical protein